jgi:hypothetical protein
MAIVMTEQSAQNMEYVRTLLKQRQPEFAAALELAVDLVERARSAPEMLRYVSASGGVHEGRTASDVAAALAGTSVPWSAAARLHQSAWSRH